MPPESPQPVELTGVAVIVVSYGSARLLEENLLPLVTGAVGLRVVVVDNRTTDDEARRVESLAERHGWTAILSPTNLGFGGGVNRGVARARQLGASRFLILNPDAAIEAAAVAVLLDAVDADPLELVSPYITRPDGSAWFAGADLYTNDGRIRSTRRRDPAGPAPLVPWLSGCCLLISDVLWDHLDGFDEEYFLYWEDVDLSYRVLAVGGSLRVVDAATAVHAEGGTQGAGLQSAAHAKSSTYYYFNIRNRLLFAVRHLDDDAVRAWWKVSGRVAWEILLQGGRRQFLSPGRPIGAALRALRDGRRLVRARLARPAIVIGARP